MIEDGTDVRLSLSELSTITAALDTYGFPWAIDLKGKLLARWHENSRRDWAAEIAARAERMQP